jgi:hypothetical protein
MSVSSTATGGTAKCSSRSNTFVPKGRSRYTVEKDQPHRLDTLAGANAGRLFDGFEETKKGCQLQSRRD